MPWGPLRGHDEIVAELRGMLERGRWPHAWLFVGPEGVGKRSFAHRLAQALLCERNPAEHLDPCGRCPACLQVDAGTHPDLLVARRPEDKHELPIAVIRQLCADLGLKPSRGRGRVAIVDDADDLNAEASNAFLKTLEEPPDRAVLILVGTAAELQLPTIVSRCRVVTFDALDPADLQQVLVDRGLAPDLDSARRLALRAEGSVARAIGLTDPTFETTWRQLADTVVSSRGFDPIALARQIEAAVKDVSKESVEQRARASLLLEELCRTLRDALRSSAGVPHSDQVEHDPAVAVLAGLGPDRLADALDRTLLALTHIQRKAYLPITLDAFFHDLSQLSSPPAPRS